MAHDARKAGFSNSSQTQLASAQPITENTRPSFGKTEHGRLRNNLLSLADQYDGLADSATVKPVA